MQCDVLHIIFQNYWTKASGGEEMNLLFSNKGSECFQALNSLPAPPSGRVHGLVDDLGERSENSGPRLRVPRLHPAGTSLGLQPHLRDGGRSHHPPQLHLPSTHRLLRSPRADCGVTTALVVETEQHVAGLLEQSSVTLS